MGASPLSDQAKDREGIPEGVPLFAYQARQVLRMTAEELREITAADLVPHEHIRTGRKVRYPDAQTLRDWHRDKMLASVRG